MKEAGRCTESFIRNYSKDMEATVNNGEEPALEDKILEDTRAK
jgi:hypothetical protein